MPIGRPLDHTQILIVDSQLKLLPLAVPGEIVIGGAGVGKGYLGQVLMTSQVFVPNPYSAEANDYLYRSGDCGYIGTDGQLYFAERLDRQVKISGYRIEPAEIESVLMQHPAVQRVAVNVVLDGQKLLAAYVEAAVENVEALKSELSAYLRLRLPDYMQPRVIMVMEELPLTAIGKIAYAQLPAPSFGSQHCVKRPPATALESQLLVIWQRTLKNPQLGVEDNFFEQDADSLAAISLIVAIESLCGCRKSIAWLIEFPTVAMQAEQLAQVQSATIKSCFSTLSKRLESTHLYLAASGYGDQLRFQSLADALDGCCTVHMLYPPQLEPERATIEAIASEYARVIMQNPPHEFYLGGFSIGGVTALETARLLEQRGRAPIRLILLDTVYPHWPLQSPWLFKILQWLSGRLILNQISLNGRKLRAMLTDPGIIVQLAGLNRHNIQPYQGPTLLVMSNQMRWLRSWLYSGWFRLLGDRLENDHVPGLHGAMFRPKYLPELCLVIKRCLSLA